MNEPKLAKHLKKLNKKKSSGLDGLSQENLLLGANVLIAPLTSVYSTLDPVYKVKAVSIGTHLNKKKEISCSLVMN